MGGLGAHDHAPRQYKTVCSPSVERPDALRRLFAEADLGLRGMTALIDTRLGRVQAIAGPGLDGGRAGRDIVNTS